MRQLICACLFLAASACATGSANAPNAGLTDNGRVAGIVKLPESMSSCDAIKVVAMANNEQVGRSTVRQSRSRCAYEITNLPANTDLSLQVQSNGNACGDAASLKLKDGQIATQDFTASCNG